jgi:hypothetical protein
MLKNTRALKRNLKMSTYQRFSEIDKHVELAEKFLAEGRELIDKDPVQASEKLYKAAEEAVKALAKLFNLPQVEEAEKIGKWRADLLYKAITVLFTKLGVEIRSWWRTAWFFHVEGFHEARLESTHIAADYKDVENLVNLAKKTIQEFLRRGQR